MKRISIIATLITLLAAFGAVAQQGPGPGAGKGPGAGSGPGTGQGPGAGIGLGAPQGPRVDALINYLQLTADQKTAWQKAHDDFQTATQALRDQQIALHDQLDTALQGTDACAIGALMLQIRAIGDQIRTAHDALDQKLASILTADQKAKYDAFQAALAFIGGPGPGGPGPNGPRP